MTRLTMARCWIAEVCVLFLILVSYCKAFHVISPSTSKSLLPRRSIPSRNHPFQHHRSAGSSNAATAPWPLGNALFMTSSDESEKETTSDPAEAVARAEADPNEDDDVSTSSVTRTILLAIPLFCKFVIVLLIKFVTDLVVYPLLLLYRFARLTKRRILKMFQQGPPVNGSQ